NAKAEDDAGLPIRWKFLLDLLASFRPGRPAKDAKPPTESPLRPRAAPLRPPGPPQPCRPPPSLLSSPRLPPPPRRPAPRTRAVARGVERAQVVGDMPFMSYQVSVEEGVRNAGRLVKEGGAEAVKLEGGAEYAELARRLSRIGIPVMGHLGLTPQSVHALGGFKVQGRGAAEADRLV